MKALSLREQTDEELMQAFSDVGRELLDLRVKKGAGDASVQPLRIRVLRRDFARIRTVMQERGVAST